ncbi:leucyl/phenylalanyl-tRNA--protein transferase [Rhodobacter aestuarii]|uniref:Leucyl/phenylalanyl-tRNA--protein transferase n=1 Tax=Rhodobacter aestuarii TaxID=453582 RepID=A0A1N7P382_9RHOB|nr:leucyl/phenylalanyl-tRNA--protein transferase [Rhodobacter aestuarii]PTV97546.1 leucyl/phenylalanyl-tRNA--protein transferase [Rhodobacter aestuarii]SIT05018.1 leucyl/phenylalanyl-tRNA--protein transferase [Rhodobacter aestuarii]
MAVKLSPDLLISAYAQGIFPMAAARDATELHWFEPRLRGIIPLNNLHISRSLAREMRQMPYTIRTDTAFRAVVEGCAERDETWINDALFELYDALHAMGAAHALEVWEGETLVGGIFGVTLGGAFFGESMFSRRRSASKIALAYTVDRLLRAGFVLFDTQYLTPHLKSMGGVEIPRAIYRQRLAEALAVTADFTAPEIPDVQSILQRRTQTS